MPITRRQTERTVQKLEDMLRACVMELRGDWESHLPLMEFTYNNIFHTTIQMIPYEALYRRKCRHPLYWDEVVERRLLGPEYQQDVQKQVALIQERMKADQSCQQSYVDKRRRNLEFAIGDLVYVKVLAMKGVIRFGKKGKLSHRYVGPIKVMKRVGTMAY